MLSANPFQTLAEQNTQKNQSFLEGLAMVITTNCIFHTLMDPWIYALYSTSTCIGLFLIPIPNE